MPHVTPVHTSGPEGYAGFTPETHGFTGISRGGNTARGTRSAKSTNGAGSIPPGPVGRRRLAHSGGRRLSTVVDEAQVSAFALLGLDALRLDFSLPTLTLWAGVLEATRKTQRYVCSSLGAERRACYHLA